MPRVRNTVTGLIFEVDEDRLADLLQGYPHVERIPDEPAPGTGGGSSSKPTQTSNTQTTTSAQGSTANGGTNTTTTKK